MSIASTATVAEVAAAHPSSVRVFQHYGIDFCCGGKKPLAAVCAERGLSFPDLTREIEAASTSADVTDHDWSRETLHALISHILTDYHQPLSGELVRLEALAAKTADAHGRNSGTLVRIQSVLTELAADLRAHMRKEELVLFPAIDALERAEQQPNGVAAPIEAMEHEHESAGDLLAALRTLTNGFAPPPWACATWRALYHGLADLEAAMHVHVHLENNILFPRALALGRAPRAV